MEMLKKMLKKMTDVLLHRSSSYSSGERSALSPTSAPTSKCPAPTPPPPPPPPPPPAPVPPFVPTEEYLSQSSQASFFKKGTLIGAIEVSGGVVAFSDGRSSLRNEREILIDDYEDKFIVLSPIFKAFLSGDEANCIHLMGELKTSLETYPNPTWTEVREFLIEVASETDYEGRLDVGATLIIIRSDVVQSCVFTMTIQFGDDEHLETCCDVGVRNQVLFEGTMTRYATDLFSQHYVPNMTREQLAQIVYSVYCSVTARTSYVGGHLKVQFLNHSNHRWSLVMFRELPRRSGDYDEETGLPFRYLRQRGSFSPDFIG